MCRSKKDGHKQQRRGNKTKYVANENESESEEEYFLNRVEPKSAKPIFVQMNIEGIDLSMEVDTGAAFHLETDAKVAFY